MKSHRHFFSFTLVISILANSICSAQTDSIKPPKKELKNTVFYNITNPLIFGFKTMIFGYERVVGKHQTAVIEGGPISMPKISILPNSIKANSESVSKGWKFALEYRFYLGGENKYNAPRGVYFAPYFSYNYFNRKNSFMIDTSNTNIPFDATVHTDFTLDIRSYGLELGYQFVFWRRFALDLILIGPGLAKYSVKTELDTSLDPDEESELFTTINDALADKIPGYSLVIKPGEFKKTGSTNTTSVGFRYLIHIGFRF